MTKNLLFLSLFTLLSFSVHAEITYINYGEGLVIPMGANLSMDVDQDGTTDFIINSHSDELDFTPIFAKGCFASPDAFSYTTWGAGMLELYELDMLVRISNSNMMDYIENGRGGVYSNNSGLADGWVDLEDQYIGYANFSNDFTKVSNGWIRVSADVENKSLIIKEIAFTEYGELGTNGIVVGDTGNATSVPEIDAMISEVSVSPNPASDLAVINFNYSENNSMVLNVFTLNGRLVSTQNLNVVSGRNTFSLNTSDWDSGMYLIRFKTNRGIRIERLQVSH